MNIYDYKIKDAEGKTVSMTDYKGKVLLIVNTATGCGLTPQYNGLQTLYKQYSNKDFEILDFPCNQFGNQAPGTEGEIHEFCQMKYKTTFKMFSKIEVNGSNEEPLYTYLKKEKGGILGSGIKWNFTKFLVDSEGNIVKRYSPMDKPEDIEVDIVKLLKK